MCTDKNCPCYTGNIKRFEPIIYSITFFSDGIQYTERVKVYNDSFYEITHGKFKGNLVHVFDVLKKI